MPDEHQSTRFALQLTHGCVVASLQGDLDDEGLRRFRADLLERVHGTHVRGVILDVGGVEVLDSHDFEELRRTMAMVTLLGARSVLVGLGPGTVSALVDLGANVDDIVAALDLEDAFRLLEETDSRHVVEETDSRHEVDETDSSDDVGEPQEGA